MEMYLYVMRHRNTRKPAHASETSAERPDTREAPQPTDADGSDTAAATAAHGGDLEGVGPEGDDRAGDAGHAEHVERRRVYQPPDMVDSSQVAELLELLGPAQASYGGALMS